MRKSILVSGMWICFVFFTLGNAQGYLVTDIVKGTVSNILDRTNEVTPVIIDDPVVGNAIDLFLTTYDTETMDQSLNPTAGLFWSPAMLDLIFRYGGSPVNPSSDQFFVDLDPDLMRYQFVKADVAMTIWKNYPEDSAITIYRYDYPTNGTKSTIKFSAIDIISGSPVPVPGSLSLLSLGILAFAGVRKYCRN